MNDIPFPYETPVPNYFREIGWFAPRKNGGHFRAVTFITWCFQRCKPEKIKFIHNCREVELEPFEFVFTRQLCSKDTGLTDKEIRTQLKHLTGAKIFQKVTSKSTSKYTVYKIMTNVFVEHDNRQNHNEVWGF